MRYFSEETVRQIVKDAMEYGMTISQTLPMDIGHYPNIEIKEPHGRCIDADECGKVLLDKYTEGLGKWDELYRAGYRYALKYFSQAPTVLGATE